MSTAPDRCVCPDCGATNPPTARDCWLCQAEPPSEATAPGPPAARPLAPSTRDAGTVVLLVAIGVVCLGAIGLCPGLGILLALILTPTAIFLLRSQSDQAPDRPRSVLLRVLATFGAVVLVGVAAVVTFLVTCFVAGWGSFFVVGSSSRGGYDAIPVAIGIGIIAGLVVAGFVVYRVVRMLARRRA